MKQHLKRLAAPARWNIERKEETYIMRPNPGSQRMEFSLPLGVIMRIAGVATTVKEIKYLLSKNAVFVDGVVRKDHKFSVGFLSVVTFPELDSAYRLTITAKGILSLVKIASSEKTLKLARINSIKKHAKGFAHGLSDGRTIVSAKKLGSTFSTVLFTLPAQEVKEVYALAPGTSVFLIAGKHPGVKGTITHIVDGTLTVKTDAETFTVNKESVIAIGKEKSAITFHA